MATARALGLLVANSVTHLFDDLPVIVVERHDRSLIAGRWVRIHQEDLAQALGFGPAKKYQSEGGPSPLQIADHLRFSSREFADDDVKRFAQALIYDWLIVGTDAHAKNYSLILAGDQARLAPLYDLNSTLPIGGSPASALSMRIGSTYRADRVVRDDWQRAGVEIGIEPEWLLVEIRRQATILPDALTGAANFIAELDIGGNLPARFVDAVANWVPIAIRNVGLWSNPVLPGGPAKSAD